MLTPFLLSSTDIRFPPVSMANIDGLLAIGGDLSVKRILTAYKEGIFPWYSDETPILWWFPNLRTCLPPSDIHISKSLHRILKSNQFSITVDTSFKQVLKHCAETPRQGQDGTWLSLDMQQAYLTLHQLGYAHSIEAWQDSKLVGGLYGIALHHIFFGESMFSLVSNASKVCFALLGQLLVEKKYSLIDCQIYTSHLASLGAVEIDSTMFTSHLQEARHKYKEKDIWESGSLTWQA